MADFSKINVNGVSYNVKDAEARETANTANTTAETAKTTATAAQTTANTAKTTADAAKTAASNAQTTANKVYDVGAEYASSTETITFTFVEES